MIRFVDIRGQGVGSRFAWYDTVSDTFLSLSGSMSWVTWDEFVEDYKAEYSDYDKAYPDTHESLCPEWAKTGPVYEDELRFYGIDEHVEDEDYAEG